MNENKDTDQCNASEKIKEIIISEIERTLPGTQRPIERFHLCKHALPPIGQMVLVVKANDKTKMLKYSLGMREGRIRYDDSNQGGKMTGWICFDDEYDGFGKGFVLAWFPLPIADMQLSGLEGYRF